MHVAHVLAGRADRADPILASAAEVALHIGALPAASAALAQRALIAIARHERIWRWLRLSAAAVEATDPGLLALLAVHVIRRACQ